MAVEIKTVMTYPLDGSTTDFNVPFEYLARKFVRVTLIGQDRRELILNQDYRFATKSTISTSRAWGPGDGYTLIEIRRYTSATERLVDFTDGSILRAYDLNISQVQTLHVAEEARDLTADTISVNNNGDLDARGRRIVNVADAKDPGDALNLGMMQRWNDSALNSERRAREEADRSSQMASESNRHANRSNDEANRSAAEADRSAQERAASSDWANWSKKWATQETPVEGEMESSRTYARHSQIYQQASEAARDAARVSETNSKQSEQNAWTHAQNAKSDADRATSEADRAKSEADKLGNWNELAGTLDSVSGQTVYWKGQHYFPYGVRAQMIGRKDIAMEFNCSGDENNPVAEITLQHPNVRRVLMNTNWNNALPVTTFNVDKIDGAYTLDGRHRHVVSDGSGWAGAGGWGGQYENNDAPFNKARGYAAPSGVSQYHPIVKGTVMTAGHGYGTAASFGMLTYGEPKFAAGVVQLIGDSGTDWRWEFRPDGNEFYSGGNIYANSNLRANGDLHLIGDRRFHITFLTNDGQSRAYIYKDPNSDLRMNNGIEGGGDFIVGRDSSIRWGTAGAHVANDGNLYGNIWGGYLSGWINGQLNVRDANINDRVHRVRKGNNQEHNSNGVNEWENPWGYFTGYRNFTKDGNIKYTTWICKRPQMHVPSMGGWVDVWD